MPRNRQTVFVRDSVFRLGTKVQVCHADPNPEAHSRRISVALTEDEIGWLDCSCCQVRRNGEWHQVTRSSFLRALVQAARGKPLALAGVSNEFELAEALRRALAEPSESESVGVG